MGLDNGKCKDLLDKLHTTNKRKGERSDVVTNGIPENYTGKLEVTHVDEDLSPIEGGNAWWACDVRLKDGTSVRASVERLIRLRGNWNTNRLSERAAVLEGSTFEIDSYVWVENYVPADDPSAEPRTKKTLRGRRIK